jgi:UDP:flavonoid glycosyltransferase YjiC (YdhE family)
LLIEAASRGDYNREVRITILNQGSRGDFQPYVALGVGLKQAGHAVRIPAPAVFENLITEHELDYVPSNGLSPQDFIRQPEIQAAVRSGGQLRAILMLLRQAGPLMQGIIDSYWRDSQDADVIIAGTLGFGIIDCAEKLGRPCVYAPLHPMFSPTRSFSNPFFAPFGPISHPVLNQFTHVFLRSAVWQMFRAPLNRWRRKVGLQPASFFGPYRQMFERRLFTVYGFSPHVLPEPDDWPAWHYVAGYWFLEEPPGWQPPEAVVRFLEAGPPPVYIGFGSMDDQNPERMTRVAADALRLSGQRGILLSGWGGLGVLDLPDTILRIESIPHSWLFPRVAAVVHHGGAGTTAAGLRAGVPSIITPLGGDQPFWAQRLVQLGVGLRPGSFFKITAEGLSAAISTVVTDTALRQRAAALGKVIHAEAGVGRAVALIQQALSL